MQFDECILNRRSVRKFEDKEIPKELIEEIITAGMYAPSACNYQAWKFICVTDKDKKRNFDNRVLENAPLAIIVCYRNNLWFSGRMHYDFIQSASAAIQNILLYAYGKGLGGVWICAYPKASLMRRYFNIPRNFMPVGCVALGYPMGGQRIMKGQFYITTMMLNLIKPIREDMGLIKPYAGKNLAS